MKQIFIIGCSVLLTAVSCGPQSNLKSHLQTALTFADNDCHTLVRVHNRVSLTPFFKPFVKEYGKKYPALKNVFYDAVGVTGVPVGGAGLKSMVYVYDGIPATYISNLKPAGEYKKTPLYLADDGFLFVQKQHVWLSGTRRAIIMALDNYARHLQQEPTNTELLVNPLLEHARQDLTVAFLPKTLIASGLTNIPDSLTELVKHSRQAVVNLQFKDRVIDISLLVRTEGVNTGELAAQLQFIIMLLGEQAKTPDPALDKATRDQLAQFLSRTTVKADGKTLIIKGSLPHAVLEPVMVDLVKETRAGRLAKDPE